MALEEDFQPVDGELLVGAINRVMGRDPVEVLPPEPDDYIRSSAFPKLCMREEVICHREGVTRKDSVDADLELVFNHGTGLHHVLQNLVLPRTGFLWGHWRCRLCGYLHWKDGVVPPEKSWNPPLEQEPPKGWKRLEERPWRETVIQRPAACLNCTAETDLDHGDQVFLFEELAFRDAELNHGGHSDGFLKIPGLPDFGVFEGKSIGPGWKVKKAPLFDHVIQTHDYMDFTGLEWAIILYWEKGTNGVTAFYEHFVEKDDEVLANIKKALTDRRDAMRDPEKPLPDRICANKTCTRALKCPVRKICFSEDA